MRTRRNRATGETPAKALLGYEIAKSGAWEIPEYKRQRRTSQDNARLRRKRIRVRQQRFQRQTYPEANEPPTTTFNVRQPVMVKELNSADPFAPAWAGPFEIARVLSPTMYEVDKNGRQFAYHVDQLRPVPLGNPEPDTYDYDDESDDEVADLTTPQSVTMTSDDASDRLEHRPAELDIDCGLSDPGKSVGEEERSLRGETQPVESMDVEKLPKRINAVLQGRSPFRTRIFYRTTRRPDETMIPPERTTRRRSSGPQGITHPKGPLSTIGPETPVRAVYRVRE